MKLMDGSGVCHDNVMFRAVALFWNVISVPPYVYAVGNFWKDRLADGPRPAELPSLNHLLGNLSLPFDLKRTQAQAAALAGRIRGDGRHVLLIPGLMASERRMGWLRDILTAGGYQAHDWGMGRNMGPRPDSLEQIDRRVDAIRKETGAPVTLVERSPEIHALLQDGLTRALEAGGAAAETAGRMTLLFGDAKALLPKLAPEVVLVDPMHPPRGNSALVKKEMRLLRAIVGSDADADELMHVALATATKRVVLKYPLRADGMAGLPKPSHQIRGKTTRYDVFMTA